MKIWNIVKNVMLSSLITTLYAIWSKEILHQVSTIHCVLILAATFLILMGLLTTVDKDLERIEKKRKEKANGKTIKEN